MDKKYAILTIAILVCGVSYLYFSIPPTSEVQHNHGSHLLLDEGTANTSNQPVYRNGQVLSTGVNTLQTKKFTNPPHLSSGTTNNFEKDTIVWHESELSREALENSGFLPEDVTNEAYIEVDLEELHAIEVGDNLDLYIPQLGGSYNGEVDHIQQHPNGDRTVEAFIPGAGSLYSAVITIGEEAIYGNLATQEDVFILEGIGRHAWIAPKSSMIAKHKERIPTDSAIPSKKQTSTDVFELETEVSPTTSNNN